MTHESLLIWTAAGSVLLLIFLVARWKVNAFVALIVVSLLAGLVAGMNLPDIGKAFGEGAGVVLGSVAMVVGLGAVLGKMLSVSGGAEVIATTITRVFGEARLPWAMMLIGLIVGLPVFFTVGLVLLAPIVVATAQKSSRPFLSIALPMIAGLSVAHGLIPPHPGPMVAIETLKADAGKTIIYALIIGIPAAVIAGPILAKQIVRGSLASFPTPTIAGSAPQSPTQPSFAAALFTVALPVLLMVVSTGADLSLPKGNRVRDITTFIGHPLCALTASVLVSYFTFGFARGFDRKQILKFTEESLAPTAAILLVVGAGGGFNRILLASGITEVISRTTLTKSPIPPLVLGWLLAAAVRIATGSATVAVTTAAGLMVPAVAGGVNRELMVISMGAGSLILSHVNDGGFWFVKEYFNLSVPQTLKTWTVIETVIAVVGLLGALILNLLLKA